MKIPTKLYQQARWIGIQRKHSGKHAHDIFLDGVQWMYDQMETICNALRHNKEYEKAINGAFKDMMNGGTGFMRVDHDGIHHITHEELYGNKNNKNRKA